MKQTEFNSGKAALDKFGFYRHFGHALKEIDGGTIWIGKTNPTAYYTENKEFFKVYFVPHSRTPNPNNPVSELCNGFKTIERAKKWANENIKGA